jgi:hypothetical protein
MARDIIGMWKELTDLLLATRKERSAFALYARPLSPDIAEVPLLSGFKVELNRRPRTLAF